LPDLM